MLQILQLQIMERNRLQEAKAYDSEEDSKSGQKLSRQSNGSCCPRGHQGPNYSPPMRVHTPSTLSDLDKQILGTMDVGGEGSKHHFAILRKKFFPPYFCSYSIEVYADRIPAVVELCWQAGAFGSDENQCLNSCKDDGIDEAGVGSESLSAEDIRLIATETLKAWESLRSGVEKLLLMYPTKVCEHCSEVHVGPSGHRACLCGVLKYESWRGNHFWRKAKVDDLVRPKIVWCSRPQDTLLLKNEGPEYYGHAPAIVDLCTLHQRSTIVL